MRKKTVCFCLVLTLSVTSVTCAADYVIGNWESPDSNDGWTTCAGWGNYGNTVLTPGVATGATFGSGALKVDNDLGWYWGMKVYVDPVQFKTHDTLKLDITRLAGDWTLSGDPNWNGINLRVQGQGVSLLNLEHDNSWWSPSNGDSPITASWDYSSIKSVFPENPSWVEFVIAFNNEGYTGHGGRGTYYLDNARLTSIPEPVTMTLLVLGGLFLRRRK